MDQFRAARSMTIYQTSHGFGWIAVQTIEELPRGFRGGLALTVLAIICERHVLELPQQRLFTLGPEQNLVLTEIA